MESLVIDPPFWRGRKVFVTGHTGFKGSWLCLWLKHLGAEVTGYSLPPETTPNAFNILGEKNLCNYSVIADIRDLTDLSSALQQSNAEIVFHLAAQPLVRRSYSEPLATLSTNIMGTANLFEAVLSSPSVRSVVNITSDKCYENQEKHQAFSESDPMGGNDPYSVSKGCAELISHSYRQSFMAQRNVALASARAGNVIGGGDWSEDRLIPDTIKAFSTNQEVIIRSPSAIRPWQHVVEPLYGYLQLAQAQYSDPQAFSGAWNFGPQAQDSISVEKVMQLLAKYWGGNAGFKVQPPAETLHEANVLLLDCNKANTQLGWQPTWNVESAIKNTVEWYKAFFNNEDMYTVSLRQIDEYSSLKKS